MIPTHFHASSYNFRDIHKLNCPALKCRSDNLRKKILTPFDRKCLHVYCWFLFHNFSFRQHAIANEFHIFKKFEIENIGQGHGEENVTYALRLQMCDCAFRIFHNFSFQAIYENERISQIFNIWNKNIGEGTRTRKAGPTAFDRKWLNMYCWFFFIYLAVCQHTKTNGFPYYKRLKWKM